MKMKSCYQDFKAKIGLKDANLIGSGIPPDTLLYVKKSLSYY